MPSYVFDSSAVLAILLRERGDVYASQRLTDALVSAVNLVEVITKLIDLGTTASDIDEVLTKLSLKIVDFNETQAFYAGFLRTVTRTKGLSLGDRACLALARATGRIALTADRAWADLDVGVTIELIR